VKRRTFLQEYLGRFALTFLLLCLIVYTVFHALGNSSGDLLTTPAKTISDTQLLRGTAWIFRDETLLTVPQAGLVHPLVEDGAKVGKNAPITEIYVGTPQDELEAAQRQLDLLNRTVKLLEESILPEGTSTSKAEGYRSNALNSLHEIRLAIRNGDWSLLSELEADLLVNLNRYGALSDSPAVLQSALEQAKADRDACLTGEKTTITNELSSAYYYGVSCVDGLEQTFTEAALSNLTPESFAALKATSPATAAEGFVAGKLCYSYSWHMAVEFANGGELFEVGVNYRIRFPENDGIELVLLCERLLQGENGGTIVVFRSDATSLSFRYLRSQIAEITVGSMEGLYVPEQAFTSLNGMDGVYIFEESVVRFRRARALYHGEGYYIVSVTDPEPHLCPDPKNPTSEPRYHYVSINDLIVVSGNDVYEGKVYQ